MNRKKSYLRDCQNLSELKVAFRKLAMMFHPDLGGDLEIMKAINNEYSERFEVLKHVQNTQAAEDAEKPFNKDYKKTYETTEMPEDFINIINLIVNIEGITIEIIGNWIWIDGVKKDEKEKQKQLKSVGFIYHYKKSKWTWKADKYKSRSRKNTTMDDIRYKYGSSTITPPPRLT